MLESLRQLHSMNIVHRDVKPWNFRVKDGRVYITDLGTAITIIDKNTGQHIPQLYA